MLFTHKNWNKLCTFILNHSSIVSVDQYLNQPSNSACVVLKHDVEHNIDLALTLGELESKLGICSTYYFQFDVAISSPEKVLKLKDLGHDIGYHYDVLDANNGDYKAATEEFASHLKAFSDIGIIIKTVCPHGNPIKNRSGWTSNKDFFRNSMVRDRFPNIIDIVVDSNLIFPPYHWYVSDAGYGFMHIGDVSNNDREATLDKNISMPDDLPLGTQTILISTHPHRWMDSKLKFLLKRGIFFLSRKLARFLSKIIFLKPIFNPL